MSSLNNLAITTVNRHITTAMGRVLDTLQSKIANGGRDQNCKFYYNAGAGGSILQVVVKSVVSGTVADLKDMGVNAFNSWMNGKRNKDTLGQAWIDSYSSKQQKEKESYGMMQVDGGTVYALDDWGCKATEAIMLGIQMDKDVTVEQNYPDFTAPASVTKKEEQQPTSISNRFTTKTLVWYDTTAIVTLSSDKNFIATRVQGRDYSRKELVSNGDIKFSVSGQISSGRPDIYPTSEMQKFFKVMQYKGIVKVNHQMLNEMGITHIVITDFNISQREGYKALQQYSFSAIGLQPKTETEITEDTITIIAQQPLLEMDESGWMSMLKNHLEGLKSMATDLVSQGAGLVTGMLDDML